MTEPSSSPVEPDASLVERTSSMVERTSSLVERSRDPDSSVEPAASLVERSRDPDSSVEPAASLVERSRDPGSSVEPAVPGPTEWAAEQVGVGPHPEPWPVGEQYDPELLADGDRRNVVDHYRYWRREAIIADLDQRRFGFHVAIENFGHDHNIGTVVRTANAFAAAAVHIIGKRRWNRRGAMVTDRYQHLHHHDTIESLVSFARDAGLVIVGVDNVPGSVPLETADLPANTLLLFGSEGPGLTPEAKLAAQMTVSIAQFGSTRSINAGVAAGIAMHGWIRQHADPARGW